MAARFPDMEVALIDLNDGAPAPEPIVAVPTYLLNGMLLWLGNPAREELFARLSENAT